MQIMDAAKGIKSWWQGAGIRQKALVLLIGVPLLISLGYLILGGKGPQMVPLFTDLDQRDAAAMVEELKANKVKYTLANQGTTILVPEDMVYELRLQMVNNGIVSGGGFELFDQTKMGATDFERRVNYQRALQEELRRTIVQIDEVEQARVHIVLPEQSVFLEEVRPASASIALKLKSARKLTPEQVQGIVLLVQNSVEGLTEDNISIIDTAGNVLKGGGSGEGADISELSLRNREIKEAFEYAIQERVKTLLDSIFGPGKSKVMITADLDFSQHERRSITYGKQVVRAETGVRSQRGADIPAGGIAGVEGNADEYLAMGNMPEINPDSPQVSEEYTRNYEFDTTEETVVFSPGEIRKISAAVVVDGQLSPDKAAEITRLVAAAIGLDESRGDQITVSGMDFHTSLDRDLEQELENLSQEERARKIMEQRAAWVKIGLGFICALFALGLITWLLSRKSHPVLGQAVQAPASMKGVAEELAATSETSEVNKVQNRELVRSYIDKNPEDAANILKTWLTFEE